LHRRGRFHRTLAIGLALLTVEAVIRQTEFERLIWDREVGQLHRPGVEARFSREGFGRSHWLAGGLRSDVASLSGAHTRVLVLGDSFTEALQVGDDQVFTALAGQQLRDDKLEVAILNAGMAGLAPSDYAYLAPRHLRVFRPAWTIIELTDHDLEGDSWDPSKIHFAFDSAGQLLLDHAAASKDPNTSLVRRFYERLTDRIALIRFVRLRLRDFAEGFAKEPPLFRAGAGASHKVAGSHQSADRVKLEVAQLRAAYGNRLTLLLVSTFDPSRPSTPSPTEQRLLDAAAELNVRLVTNRSGYPELARAGRAPFGFANSAFNVGHMNSLGHEVTSRVLANEIRYLMSHGLL
jgi:hypothetical protein